MFLPEYPQNLIFSLHSGSIEPYRRVSLSSPSLLILLKPDTMDAINSSAKEFEVFALQPALGQNIQLGMLYDVRSQQFFSGISLWKDSEVNATQAVDDKKVQSADYRFTYSLDEARNDNSLSIEGSLALDLKAFSAEGSAKYLSEKKSSKHGARLNVSCTIERRTRRIPMEVLSKMTYEKQLDSPFYTHFVSEVVEGASATLTFARSCSSEEEAKEITGKLKIKVVSIPVSGSAKVEFKEGSEKLMENVKISYSGAMAENVASLEDAQRVAKEMPSKLMTQMNTLKYKLLPLSLLDSKANKLIRSIDTGLITKTAEALNAGNEATLSLKEIAADEVFQKTFPSIRKQISNFHNAFAAAETNFTSQVRQLLPELRDGNTDANKKIAELERVVGLHSRRTEIAQQFVTAKQDEARILRETVAALLADKFEDHLGGLKSGSLVDTAPPGLLLSIGGGAIGVPTHPLQTSFASACLDNLDSGDDADLPVEEWFENSQTRANLAKSCNDIREQRKMAIPGVDVSFGVASIAVATRGGKKVKTNIGDVILQKDGVLSIVTGMLPKEPSRPTLTVKDQTLTVKWSSNRAAEEETAIPTTGFALRYRRVLNSKRDGPFPRAGENELFRDVRCPATDDTIELEDLSDDCDYQVELSVQTCVGSSPWSPKAVERTERRMTEPGNMLDFFFSNKARLTATPTSNSSKPWDFDKDRKALFLGYTEYLERKTNVKGFQDEFAVRIVDVATEYKPEIQFPALEKINETIVAVFIGPSGAGKSTQINAFVSYLLGGGVDDPARVLLIDDRKFKQSASVTQLVTCFRIRPFAPVFENKTLMIVDTPGYGGSRGVEGDAFVTAAMSEFFGMVSHVNSVIFVCKANEMRTTILSPVTTYVFSLFAKDVRKCLRTLYTFSDDGKVPAHGTLEELQWPVENGEVQVNNSAFGLDLQGGEVDRNIRSQWIGSIKGQFRLQEMLLKMTPVPTAGSAEVTKKRMQLEEKCQLAEGKILKTANDAQLIIAQLKSLALTIEAAPDQQIAHKYIETSRRDVPSGKHATLCTVCNYTCHELCDCSNDDNTYYCASMNNGECSMCPNKCNWTKHHKAKFIIFAEEKTRYITPQELIDRWNEANNTQEGALIGLLDRYLSAQAILRQDMLNLADLNDRLKETALMHNPSGLMNYVDLLIISAKAGANETLITQLTTARKTLQLLNELKMKDKQIGGDLVILVDVLQLVREEMGRRKALSANDRAAEEKKPCSLYNDLRLKLPLDLMKKAPSPLRTQSMMSKGALYEENLKAVVSLELVLKDGGVVAALAATPAS
ncbi:uncharacterized protein B0T23DRAFT_176302 [Neurospora hispaniola]|uniref:Fibronectin type-III domain-containing protein n=1 Tax=Neurospora hispaniola TaxID=588809 RepID=A0AAJ0MQP0_9PEZI|nr:hypothetical protein B0T23DRAFT_176302 [Neurospora hispaniola]